MNENNQASKTAIRLCANVLENGKDANNVMTVASVPPVFQTHVFNVSTGKHGIKNLIAEILTEREAIFPIGAENTELRPIVLAASMLASEIKDEVDRRFAAGSTRYPYATVHQYLSVFMVKEGTIGKVQLKNKEDANRHCNKPRTRYFLILSPVGENA
jgi:hypothetical protein